MRRSNLNNLRQPANLYFNATPMIDCTLQLIIFFLLAGSFASMDNLPLNAPKLDESLAKDLKFQNKVVINIPAYEADQIAADKSLAGQARCYRIGASEVATADAEKLTAELQACKAAFEGKRQAGAARDKDFQVEIRADRSVNYSEIQPVLMAVSKAGIARMNITALEESGRGS